MVNRVFALKIQFVEATTENYCWRYVALAAITGKILIPSLLPEEGWRLRIHCANGLGESGYVYVC